MIAASPPSPYAIFSRARSVWERAQYPRYLQYNVVVRVTDGGAVRTNTYETYYDARTDVISADDVSAEQRAHPHVPPSGVGFMGLFAVGGPVHDEPADYLGCPQLAPNYSFGIAKYVPAPERVATPAELVAQIRREFRDPDPRAPAVPQPQSPQLKIIGSVEAMGKDYTMTYDGEEPIGDHQDYHISLLPLKDPHRYRLRELWVDDRTYATDKLVSDGNFTVMPEVGTRWTVTFAQLDGAPILAGEHADTPLKIGSRTYSNVSVNVEQVEALNVLPAFLDVASGNGKKLTEPK